MKSLKTALIVIVCLFAAYSISIAGSVQNSEGAPSFKPEEIVQFSKRIEKLLADKKAAVAIVGRIGRPQSELPPGIQFTHTAFWVYSRIQTQEGTVVPGYAVYNLYQRNNQLDRSDLIQDFPVDFMLGVYDLKVGVIVPSRALQKRLVDVISSATYQQLHNPDYSAIASPYNNRYQNCTEFVTNVIFSSIYKTDDLQEIKANIKAWFAPQPIEVSQLKLTLGSIFMPDIKLDDHPDKPETATFSTIAEFLAAENLADELLIVSNEDTLSSLRVQEE
ncbi:hypothetical protein D1AOALGA4SA_6342 [Olavius algarvensis Delta 1 endosymbiont]|nr:hypothetical protein D1AOALGA4SA_6342 [Olavius algarvensis Delta 1 endosymbiont]